ncbi:hypothetical protein ACWEV4_25115 [Streptomyces sp. NPDC003860]
MTFTVGDGVRVETAGNPLPYTPRFDVTTPDVIVTGYGDTAGRERLLGTSFGSAQWLWSDLDDLRFDRESRELVGARFLIPPVFARSQAGAPPAHRPSAHPTGLRTAAAEDFALPQAAFFACDPEAAELRCVREPGLLDAVPDARIRIARDTDLLVLDGRMIGWSLNDPARYVTDGFADPNPAPPSPDTRHRLAECLALISEPLVEDVMDREPHAWRSLKKTERSLREQREDAQRARVLHKVVSRLIEEYGP